MEASVARNSKTERKIVNLKNKNQTNFDSKILRNFKSVKMSTTLPSFGLRMLSRKLFVLFTATKSLLFFLLLLRSSVAAAVDSLESLADSSRVSQQAKLYEFNCFADKISAASATITFHQSPIGLLVSDDPTHQLITRIFAIFLREIIYYQNVTIVPTNFDGELDDENDKISYTLEQLSIHQDYPNMAMMNLGVWMSPVGHRLITSEINDAGASMSSGRFGWFVPKAQLDNETEWDDRLQYGIFLDPDHPAYKDYIIEEAVLQALRADIKWEYFESPKCGERQCVTLLAGHRNHTAFVENHIKESGSYVNVLWLGAHLKKKIFDLYKSYQENETYFGSRFIVLHWMPSDVIDDEIQFMQIMMPHCEKSRALYSAHCKYELTPILKLFSKTLNTDGNARLINALRKLYLIEMDRKNLIADLNNQIQRFQQQYNSYEDILNVVACNWLKNNSKTYSEWISNEPKLTLTIGGIFPIKNINRGHQNLVSAVKRAVSAVNNDTNTLRNYNFNVFINDGQCRADVVMKSFIHYFKFQNVLGILGPACSETVEPIAGISKHTNVAVISYSAEGASFVDRQTYPYFFRTIGSNRQYEDVYIHLMKRFGWRRVAALTEDGQKYTEYISHMEANMKHKNLELIINKKFLNDVTPIEMNKHLIDLKQRHAKIIIADIHNRNSEMALCEAYKLGMTAREGYVWFLPSWLSKNWQSTDYKNNGSCTSAQLEKAYEGHFSLLHAPFGSLNRKMQENMTVESWLESYQSQNVIVSNYTGFVYDAVWAYAYAADKLLRENRDAVDDLRSEKVVKRFVDLIWETDFEGLSGRVRFGEGGSRISEIDIIQWRRSGYVSVGKFYPKIVGQGRNLHLNDGKLMLEEKNIVWPDNRPPGDGTYDCSFSGLAALVGADCDTAAVIFTAILFFLAVVAISLISFLFWKRRYDIKLKRSAKIMKTFGIDLLSPSRNKSNTLDKWEIPKENVVVNRRLGEGAFGTVYGGEAQLKTEGWTAVAVKTLKAGASTEDRLDFLSEAEAMKRLDHKNIVKLLGVCLQSEPIYTVMEFMLYGDLKTYLLARRHMVNDKTTDESDISPKRLTMYAMDVARGLVYLAQQKYVHRDLACRNCLVNAQRVVKLGDFGMARPTFESDYYRFNRKGMLPVRWMAPESLALGMFTPASDVWAFGVVVFEIITFGSFPFQGKTNNQVLEYVKSGKTLQVPVDAKPQLAELLKNCWNQDPRKRPTASEIDDLLADHPRLLTPCLDYPGAAVEMPETESDEFELIPKSRKCTPSKRDSTLDILSPTSSMSNFERTRALIDSMELAERNRNEMTPNNITNQASISIDEFSPTTPDGYSIMSPLLTHHAQQSRF